MSKSKIRKAASHLGTIILDWLYTLAKGLFPKKEVSAHDMNEIDDI